MNYQQYFLTKSAKLLRERGFSVRRRGSKLKINTPTGVDDVQLNDVSGLLELADRLEAMFKPKENIYDEPPDVAIVKKSGQFPEEKLPEHYRHYIMPKTRVDMYRIKEWVRTKKLNSQNLISEYNKWRGTSVDEVTSTMEDWLVDSIAFRIARKIWYVGRKPAELTDHEWHMITHKMRPRKGTFSKNEIWVNVKFKWTQKWEYESGKF